jgi:hypothetical protein
MIKVFGYPGEDIIELEQARDYLKFESIIVLVEGQRVQSWDELVRLIDRDKYANQESIEVMLVPAVTGG